MECIWCRKIGVKSHVISDWIWQCLTNKDKIIYSRTNGKEERQFLYVDDTSTALILMMEHFDTLNMITDISSNQWVTLNIIGDYVAEIGLSNEMEYKSNR